MIYRYQVVTNCGAGQYTGPLTFPKALAKMRVLMQKYPDYDDFELERVREVRSDRGIRAVGHQYWLRRNGRWLSYGSADTHDRIHNPTPEDLAYWVLRSVEEGKT